MSLESDNEADVPGLRLTAMPAPTVLALLERAGCRHMDAATFQADESAGAPISSDGTVNLVAYAAWLVRELARRDGARDA